MTYDQWLDAMLDELPDKYQKTTGYPVYDMIAAWALVAEKLEKELEDAKLLLDPENLTGITLETYVYDHAGIEREDGDFATGTVTLTGSGTVPVGTMFIASNGVSFSTVEAVTITTSGTVDVVCNSMGTVGNVAAGAIRTFSQTLPGFTSVTNNSATAGGADKETDKELLERFYTKMKTPPASGNIAAYKEWAAEITGVGSVKVFPLGHGDGTVDVVITSNSGGVASSSLVNAVQAYIDPSSSGEGKGVAPIGAHCYVSSATSYAVAISAEIKIVDSATPSFVDEKIQTEVTKVFAETFKNGFVSYGGIVNAIFDVEEVVDVQSLTLDNSSASFDLDDRVCATIGTWSVSYEYA